MSVTAVVLRPRPLEHASGTIVLLPLLPQRIPVKPLPPELWYKICGYAVQTQSRNLGLRTERDYKFACALLLVCKAFKEITLPLLYSEVVLDRPNALTALVSHIHTSDSKWDSIRRIAYSTPGRWVQTLDLSRLPVLSRADELRTDELLTTLFPTLPFLTRLSLCSAMTLSRRAYGCLATRDHATPLRVLSGVKDTTMLAWKAKDLESPLLGFLRQSTGLEELEIFGTGLTDVDLALIHDQPAGDEPLDLPCLHTLTLLSMPCSPTLHALRHSALPSLRRLTITPYEDVPAPTSLVSEMIAVHGAKLRTLQLLTPKSWPTSLRLSSPSILLTCPALTHLSLERPLPLLQSPPIPPAQPPSPPRSPEEWSYTEPAHPLTILSIPRPDTTFLRALERILSALPSLRVIRARDVRWLRQGMSAHAQEAGVQGEMRLWRRKLAARNIELLDGDWKPLPA